MRVRKPAPQKRVAPGRDPVHEIVLRLWSALDPLHASKHGRSPRHFASDLLAETFRAERHLSDEQRGIIAQSLYGMLQQARRLDFAVEQAASPEVLKARGRRHLAQYLACQLLAKDISVAQAQDIMSDVDWPAVLDVDARIAAIPGEAERLALAQSLPDWLATRLIAQYGAEAGALAAAFNQRPPLTVRANLLKGSRSDILAQLARASVDAQPSPLSSTGIHIENWTSIYRLAAFKNGLIEAQDEASQLVAELVMPSPNSLVIDACAGAGGKTLALGALMRGKGRLRALDINERRLEELRKRARRAGLSNVRGIKVADDGAWPAEIAVLRGKADRVLVDAPCSGIGAFRRNPDAKWLLSEESLDALPAQQENIARRAMELCAPNGRLIYATCTVLAAENEDVVQRLLAGSDFSLVPLKEILGKKLAEHIADPSGNYMKLLPHRHNTDGFFAAVLRRAR